MFIYKFRSLKDENDLKWAKEIITSEEFHCSLYWELNDPMEGVYTTYDKKIIDKIFNQKNKFRICSFSGENGFKEPTLWGYYANGFKGYCLKVYCEDSSHLYQMKYEKELLDISSYAEKDVLNILTTKLDCWKNEDEWRFLTKQMGNKHKIGNIKEIYFGNPYSETINYSEVENRAIFKEFNDRKQQIIEIANDKRIKIYNIKVINSKIEGIEI